MKLRTASMALPACVLIAGCLSNPVKVDDATQVKSAIKIQRDEFRKTVYIAGPRFATRDGLTGHGVVEEIALEATVMEKGAGSIAYSVYVMDYFNGGWRNYQKAHDINGKEFRAFRTNRDVSCRSGSCGYYEYLAIPVTRAYLQQHATSGIRMKISGAGGEEQFSIPAGYIAGFLSASEPFHVGKQEIVR